MKKKGFTLIELLAVIVVLAIILVLSIPKILEIIENAEKQAYKESAELMAHTAQIQYNSDEITGSAKKIPEEGIVYTFEEGVQKVSGDFELLKFKGDKPYSGTITLTKDKKVIIEKLVSKNKKWCAIKEANEKQVRVGRSTDPEFACVVEEDAPIEDKKECELETGKVTIDDVEKEVYYIDSPSDLYAFSQSVNSGKDYSGKIVKVRNNLDMSTAEGECVTSFDPIGTKDNPFRGTFDGGAKKISNLTINKPNQDNVGLFGYVEGTSDNKVNIYGIIIDNPIIIGANDTGSLIGKLYSNINIKEIMIDNATITGNSRVGTLIGDMSGSSININNLLVKKATVNGNYVGFVTSSKSGFKNSIIEKVTLTGSQTYTTDSLNNNSYHSNDCMINEANVTDGFDSNGINDINFYEAAGLDTWIGGDNDLSGYYFDYDENNKIILKSTKENPITFNLSQDNEGNYLIKNTNDWKQASIKPTEKYKIENNLDFSTNKYYMLGSIHDNYFVGTLNGNDKTISNVTINGHKADYVGIIGYVNGATIYGLKVLNTKIYGEDYVGLFGYVEGTTSNKVNIYGIIIDNSIIIGSNYTGSLIGKLYSNVNVKEIMIDNATVTGNSSVGTLIGEMSGSSTTININNLLVKKATVNGNYAGFVTSSKSSFANSIIENVTLTGSNTYTTDSLNKNSYHSNDCIINGVNVTDGFDLNGINDINFYEVAGLDTWIGGDNDSSGYYFDYDENNKIILKSTKENPITFNLSQDNEGNYLIKNTNDWKIASIKPTEKYKIENNLDFSTNKYYMLGSIHDNYFAGTLYGNDKTISNVTINGHKADYVGIIGYVNGATIYGLKVLNTKIYGEDYVGLFGYAEGTTNNKVNIYGIIIDNPIIIGSNYIGSLIGKLYSNINIKEIMIDNATITGNSWIGTLIGDMSGSSININNLLVKKATVNGNYAGFVTSSKSSFANSIIENVTLTGSNTYTTDLYKNSYHSNNCIINGVNVTDGFNTSLIGDLDYYTDKIETLYNGDANGTGYFFDYVYEKGGIYLVKAYTPVETETPSEKPNCTITYGTEESGCFLYKNGVHGNYVYRPASSEETGTGAACTGTGRDAAFRKKIIYICN